MTTVVERLHSEFQTLAEVLGEAEPSLRVTADDTFRKVLLLSAASHFEQRVTDAIVQFVGAKAGGHSRVIEFVRQKGLSRQYHTLFDWERSNANRFFSLFGDEFRSAMEVRVKADPPLDEAIRAFLELGRERNRLVHGDLGQYSLEKTADEIFALYERGHAFVEQLPALLSS